MVLWGDKSIKNVEGQLKYGCGDPHLCNYEEVIHAGVRHFSDVTVWGSLTLPKVTLHSCPYISTEKLKLDFHGIVILSVVGHHPRHAFLMLNYSILSLGVMSMCPQNSLLNRLWIVLATLEFKAN